MPALYATVEDLSQVLGARSTAYTTSAMLRALESASREADDLVVREAGCFRPLRATVYYSWPPEQTAAYYRLWLDGRSLISIETLVSGGVTIASGDYFLEPQQYGPPYTRIEINRGSSAAFSYSGGTPQRGVAILGLWGMDDTQEAAGTITDDVDDTATTIPVSDASAVGIGDHLAMGTERLEITGRAWASTATVDTGGITDSAGSTLLPVTGGTLHESEVLLVGSERMVVRDVVGSNVVVERAVDGSVLAAHSATDVIHTKRSLTCTRGARGTVSIAHSSGATVYRHKIPGDVAAFTLASAATTHLSELSGYAREVGPQGAMTQLGAGLPVLRKRIESTYGRQMRIRTV